MNDFIIKPIETDKEYAEAARLTAETFARGDHGIYEVILNGGKRARERSDFRYDKHWILVADGQIVSHAIFGSYVLQYGPAQIKVVGLGAVATALPYRGRGYNAALLRTCMGRIRKEGDISIALLNGIGNYYHRFDFVPVIPEYMVEISARDASALTSPLEIRPATPADQVAMAALYARVWLQQRPTLARTPELWSWCIGEGPPRNTQVVVDRTGLVRGYLSGRGATSPVTEAVAADPEAAQSLLNYAGQLYRARDEATIRWAIPPDDPLVDYARELIEVSVQIHYERNSGWMGSVINAQALLDQVAPVLEARGDNTATLKLTDTAMIDIQYAGTQAEVSPNIFLQLLTRLRPAPAGLRTLFDTAPAMIAPWDWF